MFSNSICHKRSSATAIPAKYIASSAENALITGTPYALVSRKMEPAGRPDSPGEPAGWERIKRLRVITMAMPLVYPENYGRIPPRPLPMDFCPKTLYAM